MHLLRRPYENVMSAGIVIAKVHCKNHVDMITLDKYNNRKGYCAGIRAANPMEERRTYGTMAMAASGPAGNGGGNRSLFSFKIPPGQQMENPGQVHGDVDGGLHSGRRSDPTGENALRQSDFLGDGVVSGGGRSSGGMLSGRSGGVCPGACAADRLVFPPGRTSPDDGGGLSGSLSGGAFAVPGRVRKAVEGKKLPDHGRSAVLSGLSDADGFHGGASAGFHGREGPAARRRGAGVCGLRYDGGEKYPCGTLQKEKRFCAGPVLRRGAGHCAGDVEVENV